MSETKAELTTRLLALLGLANRAGNLAMGYSAVVGCVRRGQNPLLIVASDIGSAQKRKILTLEPVRDIIEDVADRDTMGKALGRKEISVVAIENRNFIRGILDLFETEKRPHRHE